MAAPPMLPESGLLPENFVPLRRLPNFARMELEAIRALVLDVVNRLLVEEGRGEQADLHTPLYGRDGLLNSLMLMRLVVEVEEAIAERTGRPITLTSAQAFSARRSPFATAAALADFVKEQLSSSAG